ncbi:Uncharacterised protein [Enterobacter hormaechei]|nr:Uncharacterised protein [Enterobacter hormaechei]CZV85436.1 Uncharacterised protein [Enterobacter hormaechei]
MHDMFNVRAFKEWWIHNDNIKSFIGLVPKKVGMHQLDSCAKDTIVLHCKESLIVQFDPGNQCIRSRQF